MEKLFVAFLVLLFGLTGGHAQAASRYAAILPVYDIAFDPQGIALKYELPCGATFQGFVVQMPHADELHIGVLVKNQLQACSSMGRQVASILPTWRYEHFKDISSLPPVTGGPLPAFTKTFDARLTKTGELHMAYASLCGKPFGTFIRPRGAGAIEVGFLELVPHPRPECAVKTYVGTLERLKPKTRVAIFHANPVALEDAFIVKMTPIKEGSLSLAKSGELKLLYQRRCNEAPIGLVMHSRGDKKVALGFAVARYFNMHCPKQAATRSWAHYSTELVGAATVTDIELMTPASKRELSVVGINNFNYLEPRHAKGVAVGYFGGCQESVGLLVRDDGKTAALGILKERSLTPCKKKIEEVSWQERHFSNRVSQKRIRPLLLEGAYDL